MPFIVLTELETTGTLRAGSLTDPGAVGPIAGFDATTNDAWMRRRERHQVRGPLWAQPSSACDVMGQRATARLRFLERRSSEVPALTIDR